MNHQLVSIIIPTHNRMDRVTLAIESVLSQTYNQFEVIVVDDGSTDKTADKLAGIKDPRLRVLNIEHGGVSKARNIGVKDAKGGLIAFLDSDDIWHPEKLMKQIRFHRTQPHILISQTNEVWIRNGKRVNPRVKHLKPKGYIFPESLHLCTITPSSVLMERKLFSEFNGFDEALPACEDYDLWLKITAKYDVGLIEENLMTRSGGHSDQLSGQYNAMDRFRIYALGKILLSNSLNETQTRQVLDVLQQKSNILMIGATKRARIHKELAQFFNNLLNLQVSLEPFKQEASRLLLSEEFYQV